MITIETINGKKRLVVWHQEAPLQVMPLDKHDGSRIPIQNVSLQWLANGSALWIFGKHISTTLPSLPRHPKNDEATIRLLSLYRAHGIDVFIGGGVFKLKSTSYMAMCINSNGQPVVNAQMIGAKEITHATYNGEKIELVFEGDE